jgi:hypothetical protein
MASRMVLVCLGIAVVSSCARAQDPLTAPATVGQLKQALEENNAAMRAEIKTAIAEALALRDKTQENNPAPVTPPGTLEERVTRLEREIGNHGTALGQIAMKGESGDYHVRFDTNSQSAREQVKRAMDSTVPESAKFVVINTTNHDEWIVINGEQHMVMAGATLRLDVKPGTVTSRLRNEQQPQATFVGFPNYYQRVELKDRPLPQVGWVAANWQ